MWSESVSSLYFHQFYYSRVSSNNIPRCTNNNSSVANRNATYTAYILFDNEATTFLTNLFLLIHRSKGTLIRSSLPQMHPRKLRLCNLSLSRIEESQGRLRWTISISAEESRRGLHQGSYARQWFEKYTRHGQRGQGVSHVLIPQYASRVDHIRYTNAYAENHSSVVHVGKVAMSNTKNQTDNRRQFLAWCRPNCMPTIGRLRNPLQTDDQWYLLARYREW